MERDRALRQAGATDNQLSGFFVDIGRGHDVCIIGKEHISRRETGRGSHDEITAFVIHV